MYTDIQKVNMFKRISAYLFDLILTACLAVGLAALLSNALNYDSYSQQFLDITTKYEQMYGLDLNMEYDSMTAEELEQYMERYNQMNAAMNQDEQAVEAYSMTVSLMLVIISIGLLVPMTLLEFVEIGRAHV